MTPLIVDTGPLVALIKRRDSKHAVCREYAETITAPLLTTWAVLTEAAWLLREDLRDVDRLLQMVDDGDVEVAALDAHAARWIRRFMVTYRDQQPQLADASLMYLAENLGSDLIFSLDRRDFGVYRKTDGGRLAVVPDETMV